MPNLNKYKMKYKVLISILQKHEKKYNNILIIKILWNNSYCNINNN